MIVEDEPLASERLEKMLKYLDHSVEVTGICPSVESAIRWLEENTGPDLGFFDIQLGDGTSFDIFERQKVNFPVVFTTAYDHYAIKAFKFNSVDYLLKPVEEIELKNAVEKFEQYHKPDFNTLELQNAVKTTAKMLMESQNYKERFLVNVGEHIRVVKTNGIVCFFSEDKTTFLLTHEGRRFYIDHSLNELEEKINPAHFFRTSRKEIVNINFISDIVNYGRSRLKVKICTPKENKEIIVSRDRVRAFRNWLAQEH